MNDSGDDPGERCLPSPGLPPPYSEVPGTVPLHSGRRSGPPPSYDDVVNPDADPPSYNSLFGQVREARKSSRGVLDFVRKIFVIVLGALGFGILLGFAIFIPLTMVIIGAMHYNDCPVESIPTFLLVGGIVWITKNLLTCCFGCRQPNSSCPESEASVTAIRQNIESFMNCLLMGWFIAGCVLVYRVYPPDYVNPDSPLYCNRTVYLYAFWLVTSTFVVFGLFLGCICCLALSSLCLATSVAARQVEQTINASRNVQEP